MTPRNRRIEVDFFWRLQTPWRAVPLLKRVATHVAVAEGFRTGRLSVVVVGARAMSTLHARCLNVAEATDVLAFDLGTCPRRGELDGEIILCAAVALQRCRAQARRTPRESGGRGSRARLLAAARAELALYLTHGLLHLAGYDDQRPADFRRMHRREDELLRQLGLGPVFHGARSRSQWSDSEKPRHIRAASASE